MSIRKNIATSESGFIFNPLTGDSYAANPVATEILDLLKQGKTTAEIKAWLLENYTVEPARLERDWDDFMLQLRDANLLEN